MGNKHTLRAAILAALALPVAAQAQEVSNEELLKRLEEQDQKILVLERKLEITDEAAAAAKESTPVVSAGPKGFSLRSADGKNQLRLRGTMHLDGRYLEGVDATSIDTFVATRVRPTIEGTFGGIYDFKFMPDFGQGRTGDPGRLRQRPLPYGRAGADGQVQVAGRPRAPAVGERHEVGAARLPDQPGA